MSRSASRLLVLCAAVAAAAMPAASRAATHTVVFDEMVQTRAIAPAIGNFDTLWVDIFVPQADGVFRHQIDFTLGPDVTGFSGPAVWITRSPTFDPTAMGSIENVNIRVFDAAGRVVANDTPVTAPGYSSGFASFLSGVNLTPGSYRLVTEGVAFAETALSLDIALGFATTVPEPSGFALAAVGLGLIGLARRRAGRADAATSGSRPSARA